MAIHTPDTARTEVAVIGGGPAGLQAALTLGRLHRRVVVLDSGRYRNDPATHMHNLIGQDGVPPAMFRAKAHEELAAYPSVVVRAATARAVRSVGDGFEIDTDDGALDVRGLILATGLRDVLPATPGVADLFGTTVAHCPFCHGHEFAGRPVAILGTGPHAERLSRMLLPIASALTVLTDGAASDAVAPEGVVVRTEPVAAVAPTTDGAVITFDGGPSLEVGGLFVGTTLRQHAPFAAQLGLELLDSGCVRVDAMGRTSLPGVHAAGDLAHLPDLPMPMASVLAAAAAGQLAGAAMVAYLIG